MLRARIDILVDGKRYKAGTAFTTDDGTALTLLELGWAENVAEKVQEPAKKKTTTAKKK